MTEPTLGDLIEVAEVDTVVRLDGSSGRLDELVLTGDVVKSLGAILEAAAAPTSGAGFFVVGPFGSGKSHFLAAIGELLSDPAAASRLGGWNAALRQAAAAIKPGLAVPVPLVDYRAEARLEDVVATRAWRALGQEAPSGGGSNRRVAWDALLEAAPTGRLVLLLDELSEFLRAKQGPTLTEDLRFLQFLGEWTKDRPVVVVCALQENIESVSNVSQRELARIRDRYHPSLALSMRHVEDLVRGRLVRLRDGAETWIEKAHTEIDTAFPYGHLTLERFARCYPLHPDTLTVLEGLRSLLSQQRGVVDFICSQLRADVAAGRGYADLVTPDRVFDHFHGRLHERSESARLADTVVPYYERAVVELFDDEDDRSLALQTVKLLCLLSASSLERPRTAAELAAMVLARVSDVDPSANVSYLEEAILQPVVARGAYVIATPGPPNTYSVEEGADAAVVARSRLEQARAELNPGDRRLIATLVELGSSSTLPLQLLGDVGFARREFLWQNTLRSMTVGSARALELTPADADRFITQARATGAEGCLIVSEAELTDADLAVEQARALVGTNERLAVWVADGLTADETNAVLDMHARRTVAAVARTEGRDDLASLLENAGESDAAQAREILRRAYFGGQVVYSVVKGADLPSLAGMPFDRQLATIADPLLSALHPRHRDVAPRGELVGERILRQLVLEVIPAGRLGAVAMARGQLRPLIEGYLVPLGLGKARSEGAVIAPDSGRSPAVASLLQMVADHGPVGAEDVMRSLADGPLGLTEPEAILVLNACVQSGLVEAWRGKRRMTDPFLAVTATDRFGAGELVEPSVRSAVAGLAPIFGPGPFEPWTSSAQRSAWDYAQAWLEARRQDAAQVQSGLAAVEEIAALGSADPGPVLDDLEQIGTIVGACDTSATAPAGLRALVGAIDDGARALAAGRRLGAVARFVRDDLRRVQSAATYLASTDLVIPEGDDRLRLLWAGAVNLMQECLRLAADDRVADLFAAEREFKSAYVAAYQEAHDHYYGAVSPADVDKVRATAFYRALVSLSSIGAIAVPDDRVKIDRMLAAAVPVPCRRRVDHELAWKPRCACGFALGDKEPTLDAAALMAVAERGVQQYLVELSRDDVRPRLEDAAGDLSALGRDELAGDLRRLVSMAAPSGGEADPAAAVVQAGMDPAAVASLLDGELPKVLGDVLTGGQLIVTRDLASLREDLIGRRYTKRKLLDIVTSWVDQSGQLPSGGFIEVVDSAEKRSLSDRPLVVEQASGVAPGSLPPLSTTGGSATVGVVARRFPALAGMLPDQQSGDAFWLAAWWAGRPFAPPWLPTRLLSERPRLIQATEAALSDLTVLADLADLDARIGFDSVLGGQVAAALDVEGRSAAELVEVLQSEVLFRHPVRLAADQLLKRLAADWQLVTRLDDFDPASVAGRHALISDAEMAPVSYLVMAARHLAELERVSAELSSGSFVEKVYPQHYAAVAELISRADLACATSPIMAPETVAFVRASALRLLQQIDGSFRTYADAGFPGCLTVWDIGDVVVAPLLSRYDRVAVLLVDAMRADLARRVFASIGEVLPDRAVDLRWAVVPAPTRTAESVTAMSLGRPVPGGSVPGHLDDSAVPFSYLGYEGRSIVGADRDDASSDVRHLWRQGPPISVAVPTGVDERIHRTSVEVAALLDEATTALGRRVIPSLAALPADVPLVVLADHGFRENPSWGHGPEGRYTHGGTSPEECIIPVAVFSVR